MISQNGYTAASHYPDELLTKWVIPTKGGEYRHVILRHGHLGFVLVWLAVWFDRNIEPIDKGVWDEWGWAYRPIRGATRLSNHASGTAVDINATLHPLGLRNTFKKAHHYFGIRWILATALRSVIRWGGDYQNRADEMHFEIAAPPNKVRRVAQRLAKGKIGRDIRNANPHYQPFV